MNNKRDDLLLCGIFTVLAVVALSINGVVCDKSSFTRIALTSIDGVSLVHSVVSILIVVFAKKIWLTVKEHGNYVTHILAVLFSCFIVVGLSFVKNGDLSFFYQNKKQMLFALLVLVGYAYLFDSAICVLYKLLSNKSDELMSVKSGTGWISRNFQLAAFIAILLAWSPYLIVFWPGSVPHDGYYQINMAYGIDSMSNHHPYLLSYFMGALVALGRVVSDNFGIFVCVFVMTLIEAVCFSRICKIISQWSAKIAVASVLFFMFVPMWGSYAQAIIKDGLFVALYSVFFAETIRIFVDVKIRNIRVPCLRNALLLLLLGLSACLTRNNGIYMCIPQLLVLSLLLVRGYKKTHYLFVYLIACAALLGGVYSYTQGPLMTALGVTQTPMREALSIPVQQTARYVKYYPDDVSDEEREAIDNVLPYDQLAELYNPDKADPVKFKFKFSSSATDEDVQKYFDAWLTMFRKHPMVYVEATLAGSYAYYYPFTWREALGTYQFYIKGEPIATGDFDFHYVCSEGMRNIVSRYAELWKHVPVLCLFMFPASYTWVLLLSAGFLFYKRRGRKSSLLLVGALLNVAVCMASPVNGLPRYAAPLMACTPVIIAFTLLMTGTKLSGREVISATNGGEASMPDKTGTTCSFSKKNELWLPIAVCCVVVGLTAIGLYWLHVDTTVVETDVSGASVVWSSADRELTSKEIKGVKFTVQEDGSIVVNSQGAEDKATYGIENRESGSLYLEPGNYCLTGCPEGGSNTTYRMWFANESRTIEFCEYGDGANFTVETRERFGLTIDVFAGTEADGLLFTPTIYKISE